MKKLVMHGSIVLTLLIGKLLTAKAQEVVTILEVSPSQKSFILDIGSFDGVEDKETAALYLQIRKSGQSYLFGEAKVIKVGGKYSLWSLTKRHDNIEVAKGDQLSITRKSYVFEGRERLRYKKKSLVVSPRASDEYIEWNNLELIEQQKNDYDLQRPEDLTKLEGEYRSTVTDIQKDYNGGADIDLVELRNWSDNDLLKLSSGDQKLSKKSQTLLKAPSVKKVDEAYKDEIFDNVVNNYEQKVSANDFSFDELHKDSKRDSDLDEFQQKGSQPSTYTRVTEKYKNKKTKSVANTAAISEQGETWSEEMSEEQMINFIKNKSIKLESKLQEKAYYSQYTNHVDLNISSGISNHQNDDFSSVNSLPDMSIGASYEYNLIRKSDFFSHFSLAAGIDIAKSAYDLGPENGSGNEYVFNAFVNYYPFFYPTVIERLNTFIGLGIKRGRSFIQTDQFKQTYSISSTPHFQLGVKYLTDKNYGFKLLLSFGKVELSASESVSNLGYEDTININDIKTIFGALYYF